MHSDGNTGVDDGSERAVVEPSVMASADDEDEDEEVSKKVVCFDKKACVNGDGCADMALSNDGGSVQAQDCDTGGRV
jgi:hypothetical protein